MAAATVVDLIAGSLSGIAVTIVGHPFDTLKVRLQTQPSPPNQIYNGLFDCVKKTIAWEGPAGFYKGVAAPLVGQVFFRSALFWCNGTYLRWASNGTNQPLTYLQYALGGAVTWGVGTLVECPVNTVASQMQVAILRAKANPAFVPEFAGVGEYVKRAPRNYGLRSLYLGLAPHFVRNCIGGFWHFGAFEYIRRETAKKRGLPVSEVGLGTNMLAGSVGGLLYWTLSYPIDVLKSALQADELDPNKRRYNGALDAAKKLWAEGGIKRFTRGFSPCIARAMPANAVLLTVAFRAKEIGYEWAGVTPAPAAAAAVALSASAAEENKEAVKL